MKVLEWHTKRVRRSTLKTHTMDAPFPHLLSSCDEGCDRQVIAQMVRDSTHLAYLPADFGDRLKEKERKKKLLAKCLQICRMISCHIIFFIFLIVLFGLYRCFFFSISVCRDLHMIRTHDLNRHASRVFYTCFL